MNVFLIVVGVAVGAGVAGAVLWLRLKNRGLRERLRRTASPFGGGAVVKTNAQDTIFRSVTTQRKSRLLRAIATRYPLVDPRYAILAANLAALGAVAASWFSLWFLRISADWWIIPLYFAAVVMAVMYVLSSMQRRKEIDFVGKFPEAVDQIVRLAGAGVPPLEAISVVAEDAEPPLNGILREVSEGLEAGLDPAAALDYTSGRIRLPEFTLFSSALLLQRRAGGRISESFSNLAETLREGRAIALKARASTAQTRLSLLVLTLMPIAVLAAQSFTSPESLEQLFNTEDGLFLLRLGVALIVIGLVVARTIAASCEKR